MVAVLGLLGAGLVVFNDSGEMWAEVSAHYDHCRTHPRNRRQVLVYYQYSFANNSFGWTETVTAPDSEKKVEAWAKKEYRQTTRTVFCLRDAPGHSVTAIPYWTLTRILGWSLMAVAVLLAGYTLVAMGAASASARRPQSAASCSVANETIGDEFWQFIGNALRLENLAVLIINPLFRCLLIWLALSDSAQTDAPRYLASNIYGFVLGDFAGHLLHGVLNANRFEFFLSWFSLVWMYLCSTPDPKNPFVDLGIANPNIVNHWTATFVCIAHLILPLCWEQIRGVQATVAAGSVPKRPSRAGAVLKVLCRGLW